MGLTLQQKVNDLVSQVCHYQGAKTDAQRGTVAAILKTVAFLIKKEREEGSPKTMILFNTYSTEIDTAVFLKEFEKNKEILAQTKKAKVKKNAEVKKAVKVVAKVTKKKASKKKTVKKKAKKK